jgi:hypothetical protein
MSRLTGGGAVLEAEDAKPAFFRMPLGGAAGAVISCISFWAPACPVCNSEVIWYGCPGGYNVGGIFTVRGSSVPLERMFGVPRERDSGRSDFSSILCNASSMMKALNGGLVRVRDFIDVLNTQSKTSDGFPAIIEKLSLWLSWQPVLAHICH